MVFVNRIEMHRRRGGECNDTATIAGKVFTGCSTGFGKELARLVLAKG
jgi:hypothetical protein